MPATSRPALAEARVALRANCSRCAALCCAAPVFVASADFAIDKPAGRPCPNLGRDDRCTIHAGLRERGFAGCAVFDCFGAGQHVVEATFGRHHWRDDPAAAASMFAAFEVVRQLKELSWYLIEALLRLPGDRLPGDRLRADVQRSYARNEHLMSGTAEELAAIDAAAQRRLVAPLLIQASEALRADVPRRRPDRIGMDLINARLRGTSFAGASLRGAYLLGADLRDADLHRTDLLGADLRAADLRGAQLRDSLFLTQPQLNAARGDLATTIPRALSRPQHWRN